MSNKTNKLKNKILKYKLLRQFRQLNNEGLNLVDECIAQVRYERRYEQWKEQTLNE